MENLTTDQIREKYPVKTDQEIYEMALVDWYNILATLWIVIGKPVDKKRLIVYGKELGKVPCELLERAIRRIHLSNTYLTVPPIGEIWQAVNAELSMGGYQLTVDQWIEQEWINFMDRIRFK
jgi:hypothetical protein